jgi:hypothetical protein
MQCRKKGQCVAFALTASLFFALCLKSVIHFLLGDVEEELQATEVAAYVIIGMFLFYYFYRNGDNFLRIAEAQEHPVWHERTEE